MANELSVIVSKLFDESEADEPDFAAVASMVESLGQQLDAVDDTDLLDSLEEYVASWSAVENLEEDAESWREETAELVVLLENEGYID